MHFATLRAATRLTADRKTRRILGADELPIHPAGERIVLRPNPPDDTTEGGLVVPEIAQNRPFSGKIIAGGLQALDKLYDAGIDLGDEVWWGKFAGVIEEWDHIVEDGRKPCGGHDWRRAPAPGDRISAYSCECGATRWVECIIVANVDDILGSVEQAERLRKGELAIKRGTTPDGATCHYFVRGTQEGV